MKLIFSIEDEPSIVSLLEYNITYAHNHKHQKMFDTFIDHGSIYLNDNSGYE